MCIGNPNTKHRTTVHTLRATNLRMDVVGRIAPVPRGNYHPPGEEHMWSVGGYYTGGVYVGVVRIW